MSINSTKKEECFISLLNLRNSDYSKNFIIIGDLNIIKNGANKRGGIFGRYSFRDNIEDLITDWYLLGIPSQRGKFTSTNMRAGLGYIEVRLDFFLVHNNFIHQNDAIKYYIVPSLIYDHKPISLHLQALPNYNPLPFWFNPLWLQHQEMVDLVRSTLETWIPSMSVFIREHKIIMVKKNSNGGLKFPLFLQQMRKNKSKVNWMRFKRNQKTTKYQFNYKKKS